MEHHDQSQSAKRRVRSLKKAALMLVLCFGGGITLGVTVPPDVPSSSGWQYAADNCGCASGITTDSACQLCCRKAVLEGKIDAADVGDCTLFCTHCDASIGKEFPCSSGGGGGGDDDGLPISPDPEDPNP